VFAVSPATIRRDAQVTTAVNKIAEVCGCSVRPLLLARTTRLSRGRLVALADLPEAKQKEAIFHLHMHGRLPRSWHEGESETITLPRAAADMARAALRRLGTEEFLKVRAAFNEAPVSPPTTHGRAQSHRHVCLRFWAALNNHYGGKIKGDRVH
jgi:hypothetical protein